MFGFLKNNCTRDNQVVDALIMGILWPTATAITVIVALQFFGPEITAPEMIPLVAIHLVGQLVGTIFLSVTLGGDEDILAYHYNGHKYVQLRYWVLATLVSVLPTIALCICIYCCTMAADVGVLLLLALNALFTAFCTFIGVCGTYSIWQIHQREQQAAARRCQYSIH